LIIAVKTLSNRMQEFKIGCNWTKRLQLLLLFLFVHVVYGLSQFNLANFDKQIITFILPNLFIESIMVYMVMVHMLDSISPVRLGWKGS